MSQHIQLRRDTAANWTAANPTLALGEFGIETDTRKFKFGTGVTAWNSLAYAAGDGIGGLLAANNLADLASPASALVNLGAQATLIPATNIKTIGGLSPLGAGDIPNIGGIADIAGAPDKATIDLPAVNTPLSNALTGKQAALASGTNIKTINGDSVLGAGDLVVGPAGAGAQLVAWSSAIPLDRIGAGKKMATHPVTTNTTLTVAVGAVEEGNCLINVVGNGTATLGFSGITADFPFDNTNGKQNIYAIVYAYGTAYAYRQLGGIADTTAPTLAGIAVENATPSVVDFTFNEAIDPTAVPAAADFTVSGHTTTGTVTISGTVVSVPLTAPFVFGEAARTGSYTQGFIGTRISDLAGNFAANFSAQAITNNVAATAAAPAPVSEIVANATPSRVDITFDRTLGTSTSTTPADYPFTSSGGQTVASVARSGAEVRLTLSAAMVFGQTAVVGWNASKVWDSTNTFAAAAVASTAVTNNVASSGTVGDTFTRGDGALGTASDGVAWNLNGASWVINGNKAMVDYPGVGPGGEIIAFRANAKGADCTVDWSEILIDAEFPGVICRVVDANNYHLVHFPNNGGFVIYRLVAGVYSGALLISAGSQYTPNSVIHLVVQNNSTTGDLTVTCNGNTPEVLNDATNKTEAKFGMYDGGVAEYGTSLFYFKTVVVTTP